MTGSLCPIYRPFFGKLEAPACKILEKFIYGIPDKVSINQGFVKQGQGGIRSGFSRVFWESVSLRALNGVV
jgi:hypothetical protein